MNLVEVDQDRCIYCGACLDECPFRLLEMKTADSLPTAREIEARSAWERCINCGHCAVVCPTDALTVYPPRRSGIPGVPLPAVVPERQGPDDCRPILPELEVSPAQVDQQLMGRRTHRAYKAKPLPRETLEELIRVAAYAPTPHNSQSARWLVISDKGEIRRIAQTVIDFMKDSAADPRTGSRSSWDYRGTDSDVIVDLWEKGEDSIFRGAPHLILAYGPSFLRRLHVPPTQFVINLTFLELAAYARGLATVWIGFLMAAQQLWPPRAEAIGLPEGQEVYAAMGIGYPKNTYRRIPLRNGPEITWR
jgi:nitroreductase/ferredoxin